MTNGTERTRDRGAALSDFVQVLTTNPSGDGAARAMVLGALSPLGATAGQIYGSGRPATLELLGNFGWPAPDAAAFRALSISLPLPACDAFTTVSPVILPWRDLPEHYPMLATTDGDDPGSEVADGASALVVCVPIVWAQAPVGVLVALLDKPPDTGPAEWHYLDGVAAALALWLLEQRRALIDAWRTSARLPHADVAISPRQHRILELVGDGKTDAEIAEVLGVTMPLIRQDIKGVMELMGTKDRRTAAGRAREIGLLPDRRARDGAR